MSRPLLQIIIASTRPTRAGAAVGAWIADAARAQGGFDVEVVDLVDVDLPIFNEPNHPMTGNYVHEHTKRWSATISRAQAFVIVTPEYNHSFPGSLKNALDYLSREWRYKAVGLVSYGGVSAGLRAVTQLKPVLAALRMVPVTDAVSVPFLGQRLDESGAFRSDELIDASAKRMLDELVTVGTALIPLQSPAGD
ncbi:NAD(P)H-dependent FMN reductase [Parafrankia irregularis]|uniref:NAD(P)H-dependent FMN reductase n=1 Tax=Parafrankia irregularis TaxID=795642 RepID=A0A0S4QHW1_9ACTN|nr:MULTISPECIES: NADPH-dependent FMN reductase [Parafrankia]MBE3203970.1 NAD(P)H-dependent oxidoreductase [Parafrankia sp. CH37]CUU55157.1 NAD(P)H-dependent FMN reductase [Parafrankia irregularis]